MLTSALSLHPTALLALIRFCWNDRLGHVWSLTFHPHLVGWSLVPLFSKAFSCQLPCQRHLINLPQWLQPHERQCCHLHAKGCSSDCTTGLGSCLHFKPWQSSGLVPAKAKKTSGPRRTPLYFTTFTDNSAVSIRTVRHPLVPTSREVSLILALKFWLAEFCI